VCVYILGISYNISTENIECKMQKASVPHTIYNKEEKYKDKDNREQQ
jgi:hypothetical protein